MDSAQLFGRLHVAELAIFIEVNQLLLPARYDQRGGAAEDENLALVERFARAYTTALPRFTRQFLQVENNGNVERAYGQIASILNNRFNVDFDVLAENLI
jgi:ribose 1,5-bisphosphokinase PhnN